MDEDRVWRRHFRRFIRGINMRKQYLLHMCGCLLQAGWAGFDLITIFVLIYMIYHISNPI